MLSDFQIFNNFQILTDFQILISLTTVFLLLYLNKDKIMKKYFGLVPNGELAMMVKWYLDTSIWVSFVLGVLSVYEILK